ncbi:MAG: hypothetical protein AAFX53_04590 [Bacteroidota bacterium]
MKSVILIVLALGFLCCSTDEENNADESQNESRLSKEARITQVTVSGNANNYTFNVTIESPDTGCDQYADWWEVIDMEGNLIHRRVLAHSHVDEQPFTRSGTPVRITTDRQV